VILNVHYAIDLDFLGNICTNNVSLVTGDICALAVLVKVDNIRRENNVVNPKYTTYLVGISETKRVTTYGKKETRFNQ